MECSDKIRIATPLITHTSKTGGGYQNFSGLEERFLDMVLKALKMPYELISFEASSGGNRTDPIDMINKDEADVSFSLMSMTHNLSHAIDFIHVYLEDDQTFAIKKLDADPTFLYSFDLSTWILTLSAILSMPLIFRFLFGTKYTYIDMLIQLLGSVLGQPMSTEESPSKYKIFISVWLYFAKFLAILFSAAFSSILTVPSRSPKVRNFEELSNAVARQNYKCFIHEKSVLFEFLIHHEKEYLQRLGKDVVHHNRYFSKISQINTDSAVVSSRRVLQMITSAEQEKYFISSDVLELWKLAMPMKKGFCLKKGNNTNYTLQTFVTRVNNGGLFGKLMKEEAFKILIRLTGLQLDEVLKPLSCHDLIGAFIAFLIGLGLSFLVLVCEIVMNKRGVKTD
ncbi:uncharacterized protein NPIL_548291 [Nephila pilipes]|uniref:Ionotropic receptor n=1 Tax=Nephila pilipes TaxID=299642 RepID=A0A8X6PWI7_NEPPI|nr:uncharacterized protein NPIL_548291 [Nephila pilipes]